MEIVEYKLWDGVAAVETVGTTLSRELTESGLQKPVSYEACGGSEV